MTYLDILYNYHFIRNMGLDNYISYFVANKFNLVIDL